MKRKHAKRVIVSSIAFLLIATLLLPSSQPLIRMAQDFWNNLQVWVDFSRPDSIGSLEDVGITDDTSENTEEVDEGDDIYEVILKNPEKYYDVKNELQELGIEEGTLVHYDALSHTYLVAEHQYVTVFGGSIGTYTDDAGKAQFIDNTLVETDSGYMNKANAYAVLFPNAFTQDAGITVFDGEYRIELIPTKGDYTHSVVRENSIRYNSVHAYTDIQYTLVGNTIKEDIILLQPVETAAYEYILKSPGLTAEISNNQIYLYPEDSTKDDVVYILRAPYMEDAAGEVSFDIQMELRNENGKTHLRIIPSEKWLKDQARQYPVRIDPTISSMDEDNNIIVTTAGVEEGSPGVSIDNKGYLYVGYDDGSHTHNDEPHKRCRLYIKIDINDGAIPNDAVIDNATFSIAHYTNYSNGQSQFALYAVNEKWPSNGNAFVTWNNQPQNYTYIGVQNAAVVADTYIDYDVTETVTNWLSGAVDNHGFMLRGHDTATKTETDQVCEVYNIYQAPAPKLSITWSSLDDPFLVEKDIDDTTINLRPLTEKTLDGQLILNGIFVDGLAAIDAKVTYQLYANGTMVKTFAPIIALKERLYPDSTQFQEKYPNVYPYLNTLSNWQSELIDELDTDVLYQIKASASKIIEGEFKTGVEVASDTFLIYEVKDYDTLPRIAKHYGVSQDDIMRDNRVQDAMVMAGNTLIIRNPKTTEPYNPGELTDKDKMTIDAALLGRGEHCEFGFEPINLNTGNFYMNQTDALLPELNGDFIIGRTYNSLGANVNSAFGRGWSFVYDQAISLRAGGDIVYRRADGSGIYFVHNGNGTYTAPAGYVYQLEKNENGWQLTDATQTVYAFNSYGLLVSVADKKGFVTALHYDDEYNLSKIVTPSGKEFHFTVDGEGHITKVILPNGKGVSYQYDEKGNLIAVRNPRGDVRTYQYDDKHQMISWADENGNTVIVNVYDEAGRVVKQTDANGGVATLIYGDHTTTTVDNEGNRTIYKYDNQYRTIQIVYPDGSTCHKTYNEDNRLATEITVKGKKSYTYDKFGNVITEVREDGASLMYLYDEQNRIVSTIGYTGGIIRFEYNDAGDLICNILPDGSRVTYDYDTLHRLIAQTDGRGNTIYYSYDGANLVSYIDGEGHKWGFTYDAMNRQLSSVDPLGNTTTYTYDNNGNKTSETAPDGGRTTYQLDAVGNILTETDPMGNTTTYAYDKMYNIIKVIGPTGNTATFKYDKNGKEIERTDALGNTITYTRDCMGRVVKEESVLKGTTIYEYDLAGNLVKIVDANGNATTSEYNTQGKPIKITDALGNITQYMYDAVGNEVMVVYADGSSSRKEYDVSGRLVKEISVLGAVTSYTYDANGNVLTMTYDDGRTSFFEYDKNNKKVRDTNPEGGVCLYRYDAAGRQIAYTNEAGQSKLYTYDQVGRVTTVTDALGYTITQVYDKNGNIKSTIDVAGNVTTYTHDAYGNVTSITDALGNITVMKYDVYGNLIETIDALKGVTTFEYDYLGNLLKLVDACGNVYSYVYDKNGNNISIEGPERANAKKKYNAVGQVVYAEDAEGLQVNYTYNERGYVLSQIDNAGNVIYYTYDAAGNVLTTTDQIGRVTAYSYDKYGRLLAVVEADGSTTSYEYDAMNRVIAVTDAEGVKTEFAYDEVGNQIAVIEADGAIYTYTYDALNRLLAVVDPLGDRETYVYDELGNVVSYTDKNGAVINYTYDANSNLLSITDGKGGVTSYEYDEVNRRITEISPEGATVEYRYDALGNINKHKDATGAITQYVYDGLENVTQVISPKGQSTIYTYDTHGNVLTMTDPLGNITASTYNLNNQVTSMVQANGGTYTYTYDKAGRLETITSPLGFVTTLFYDDADNVIKESNSLGQEITYSYDRLHRMIQSTNAVGGITTFAYDIRGNLISETNALGYTNTYAYDVLSRVIEEKNPLSQITKYTYDKMGNLELVEEANGAITQYVYDSNNNVINVIDPLGNVTTYSYDKSNQLTRVTDALSQTMAYMYDASGRMVAETDKSGTTTGYEYDLHGNVITLIGKMGLQTHYKYDDNDNLISVEDSVGSITHYQYDNMGWLTTHVSALGKVTEYTYDLEGNQTSRTDASGRKESYEYDSAGRLEAYISNSGNITHYDYNQLNQLVEKSYKNALGETDGTSVLYGYDTLGQRITMLDAIGEADYKYDALGRVVSVTDSAGQTVTYAYDEVGNLSEIGYPDGTTVNYEYDWNRNLVSVEDRNGEFTYYKYDALNRMVETIRPNYLTTYVTYDALDHITKLETVNTVTGRMISSYTYQYNEEGYVVSEVVEEAIISELFEGVFEEFLDTILGDVDWENSKELQFIWQKFFEVLHIGCDHNDADGDGKLDYCRWEQLTTSTEYRYEYDDNFQLTKCTEIGEYIGTITYEYRYDEDGNRVHYIKRVDGIGEVSYSYQYNSSNQLISRTNEHLWTDNVTYYTYDEDGNRISEKTGLWETTYEYTAENRLSVVRQQGVVLMAALYDGDNNRLFTMDYTGICMAPDKSEGCGKEDCPFHNEEYRNSCFAEELEVTERSGEVILPDSGVTEPEEEACTAGKARNRLASLVSEKAQKLYTTTEYVNDITYSNEQVLAELNCESNITNAYIYGNNRIASDVGDGTLYYLYDRTGSVAKIATEWGRIQESYSYDPYGNLTYGIPDSVNYYGYNGESTNLWTDLQYLRARYYDMSNGNFLSEDTYAGQVASPLTLNRYTYVCNNPVNYVDPSGHRATSQFSQTMHMGGDGGLYEQVLPQIQAAAPKETKTEFEEIVERCKSGEISVIESIGAVFALASKTRIEQVTRETNARMELGREVLNAGGELVERTFDIAVQNEIQKAQLYQDIGNAVCEWFTDPNNQPFINLALSAAIITVAGVVTLAMGAPTAVPVITQMVLTGLLSGGAHAFIDYMAGEDPFEGFSEGFLGGVAIKSISPGVDQAINAAITLIPSLQSTAATIALEGFGETVVEHTVVFSQTGGLSFESFMADWLINSFTNGKNPTMQNLTQWLDDLCQGAKAKIDEWFGVGNALKGGSDTINTLTDAQKSRLNSLNNTINDHLTESDFSGTLRDLQGDPVPNGKGGYFDHAGEMRDSYRSLQKIRDGLEGSLKNPNLSDVDRALLQEGLDKANSYIKRIEELFDPYGGIN